MRLDDPRTLKAFLGKHGLVATKGLGQHFLCSGSVVDRIVARVSACAGVLEIGPGPGVLTSPISEAGIKTIALELDPRMVEALKESAPRADVRPMDALKADLEAVLLELPTPRAVVSNLPYYITGPLITRIAESKAHWSKAVLMMQREVAQRVMAAERQPERGSLSVYLQAQFAISLVGKAPAGAFLPPPKVDSTVLELTPLAARENETDVLRLVRLGFTQPRKTIVNNLSTHFGGRERVQEALQSRGLVPLARPQELSVREWFELASNLLRDASK